MDPRLGRYALRIAMFIVLTAVGLLIVLPRGTAEYYITQFSLLIGLVFAAGVAALVRFLSR